MTAAKPPVFKALNPEKKKQLDAVLENSGISRQVYALTMPETEHAVDSVIDGEEGTEINSRDDFHSLYREAWTQKQDHDHKEFFDNWFAWSSPIVEIDREAFPFNYPTSGASEGLRVAFSDLAARALRENMDPRPKIHIFEGEYEGFKAYAEAAGLEVVEHKRSQWKNALSKIGANDQFYLSHPSAIDGMVWNDYDAFAKALYKAQPKAELMVDLTYVGCVARDFKVNVNYPNIPAVFFSLSKPFGAYYHRIGGMISRRHFSGLTGNIWFKNLFALKIGSKMMERHGVYDLPRKYYPVAQQALERARQLDGFQRLELCDVFLLASMAPNVNPSDLELYLLRGPEGEKKVRVCLTPTIAGIIDPKLNTRVSARFYETLPERPAQKPVKKRKTAKTRTKKATP